MAYIYAHCSPDGSPFYIGKGSNGRAFDFNNRRAEHRLRIEAIQRHHVQVVMMELEDEFTALAAERMAIQLHRLAGFDLVNQNDGGDGPKFGYRHREETKLKIRIAVTATMSTPEFKQRRSEVSRRAHTPAVNAKVAAAAKRQWSNPEQRLKKIQGLSGFKWITNGPEQRRLYPGQRMPVGFFYGRGAWSPY